METIVAILKAAKAFFLMTLMIAALVYLLPGLGLFDYIAEKLAGGETALLQFGLGLALLAILFQSARSVSLQRHQSILARQLLKLSPDLRKLEAVKILVQALVGPFQVQSFARQAGPRLFELMGGREHLAAAPAFVP